MNDEKQEIDKIMNQYSRDVYLLAYSFVKDQGMAEDISQEVFIKCFRHLKRFRGDSSIKSWIIRITINTAKDFIRKDRFRVLPFPKWFFENGRKSESTEQVFIKNSDQDHLLHKVLSLPLKYREAIVLHYFQDLSVTEIGKILDLNSNTVKTRLVRGRALLKDKLIFEEGDAFHG